MAICCQYEEFPSLLAIPQGNYRNKFSCKAIKGTMRGPIPLSHSFASSCIPFTQKAFAEGISCATHSSAQILSGINSVCLGTERKSSPGLLTYFSYCRERDNEIIKQFHLYLPASCFILKIDLSILRPAYLSYLSRGGEGGRHAGLFRRRNSIPLHWQHFPGYNLILRIL